MYRIKAKVNVSLMVGKSMLKVLFKATKLEMVYG